MPGEHLLLFTRNDIPQPHCLVPTPASNPRAIGTERYAIDRVRMPGEHLLLFTRLDISQVRIVPTPARNHGAIRAEHYASDPICMSGEKPNLLTGCCIIEPNTDGADDSNLSDVRRNTYPRYPAFTDPRNRAFGETPLHVLLSKRVRQKQNHKHE